MIGPYQRQKNSNHTCILLEEEHDPAYLFGLCMTKSGKGLRCDGRVTGLLAQVPSSAYTFADFAHRPPTVTTMAAIVFPPDPCPVAYTAAIELIDKEPKDIMLQHRTPYYIMQRLANEGFTTLRFLGARWRNDDDFYDKAAEELQFDDGKNGYNVITSRRALVALYESWNQINRIKNMRNEEMGRRAEVDPTIIMSTGQRDSMRAAYRRAEGVDPPRAEEGSDFLLGDTFRMAQHGDLPAHRTEQISSKIPDAADFIYNVKETKKDKDNYSMEVIHQERRAPVTWDAWKRQLQVFKTSLLMVIYCFPMQTKIQVTKKELDKYYEFLLGPDIVGRDTQPSLRVMIQAERRAWRRIVLDLAEGTPLTEALKTMKGNTLFWQTEVLNKATHQPNGMANFDQSNPNQGRWRTDGRFSSAQKRSWTQKGNSKSKRTKNTAGEWAWATSAFDQDGSGPSHAPKGKGKGKHKGKDKGKKGKGKGKGKPQYKFASQDNKGKYYCWDFQWGKCTKGHACPSSHRCPVIIDQWGTGCNGKHMAADNH
jgi:hypothetical protein